MADQSLDRDRFASRSRLWYLDARFYTSCHVIYSFKTLAAAAADCHFYCTRGLGEASIGQLGDGDHVLGAGKTNPCGCVLRTRQRAKFECRNLWRGVTHRQHHDLGGTRCINLDRHGNSGRVRITTPWAEGATVFDAVAEAVAAAGLNSQGAGVDAVQTEKQAGCLSSRSH